jgi:carboxylesterase
MKQPTFQNPDLDGRSFFLDGSATAVLLLHGFTATTVEVRPLAEYLHRHGLSVSAPLLPGHGTVPEDMHSVSWQDWANAVEKAYQDVAIRHPHVYVGGESLGGLLTLYLASRHPEIAGILLFAPALQLRGVWPARFLAPFIKTMPKTKSGVDPAGNLPWQGYTVVSLPALNQLRKLQDQVCKSLPAVRQPAFIIHGKKDQRVAPLCSQIIFDRISSEKKELMLLENSGHTLLLDIERDFIYQKALEFIRQV